MPSKESYTSASAFPCKLYGCVEDYRNGFRPTHVQLNISNACQLNCEFCSCKDRDRKMYMDFGLFKEYMDVLRKRGMDAVTITGGGEPLLHPRFQDMVEYLVSKGVSVGLVTNGIAVRKWPVELYQKMSWIRVSFDASRKSLPDLYDGVKWAFSYVYSAGAEDTPEFKHLVEQAGGRLITHLRVVTDIFDDDATLPDIDVPNVIMQNRSTYTGGAKDCWISLIKPVIDVTGLFFPCCGTQYAIPDGTRDYHKALCMGNLDSFLKQLDGQIPFYGGRCVKCYYDKYNEALRGMVDFMGATHKEFI